MDLKKVWLESLNQAQEALNQFINEPKTIENSQKFSEILIDCYKNKGTTFSCGNGGSHCDAMHFAEELTGRYRKDRRPLGALALGDSSHVTCVSNDYGFEHIFSRQVEALARPGDVLIGISTSGNSQNVILALQSAKAKGMKTIALLGKDGGKIKAQNLADCAIIVPGKTTDRIQELHIKLIHIVIETVERALFPEHYS